MYTNLTQNGNTILIDHASLHQWRLPLNADSNDTKVDQDVLVLASTNNDIHSLATHKYQPEVFLINNWLNGRVAYALAYNRTGRVRILGDYCEKKEKLF